MKKILSLFILLLLTINITTIAQNNGCATTAYYSSGPIVNGSNLSDGFTFDCTQPLQIEWCYTVEDFSNTPNNNWLHGIYPNPDPNWALTGTAFTSTGPSVNDWIFEYGQPAFGAPVDGFFFDDNFNGTSIDGFGDPDSQIPGIIWNACFTFDYIGGCPSVFPVVDMFELVMNVSDDGFSGAFNNPVSCPPCPAPDLDPFTNLCLGNGGGGFSIQFAGPGQITAQANNIGCSCDNPNNIDIDGDGIFDIFYEEITISTNPPTSTVFDWNITFQSGNWVNATGAPAPTGTPFNNGDGTYTYNGYVAAGTTYDVIFDSPNENAATNIVSGGNCGPCDGTLNLLAPCSCINPNNVDLDVDGNTDLFYEEITLTTNPSTIGITDWTFGNNTAGNFFDATGAPITTPATTIDNGDGTYTFTIYLLANQAYNIDFTSVNEGFGSTLLTGGNCAPCSTIDLFPIPCQCDEQFFGPNPQFNIDFDGDQFADLIYQQMEITTTPPTPGITNWVLGPTSFGIFDANYNPTLNGQPIFVTDNGNGTYFFEYYTESEQPYTIDIQQGSIISPAIFDVSCGPCPIIDPCTCDNPLNVDLDGDGEYDLFHEEITYQTSPPITGINDWVFGTDTIGPFFDATGMAITAPVSATDNGDGTYSFVVFLAAGQPYAANFTSTNANILTGTVSGGNCEPCPIIPTLSEWGLIFLALLLLSYGSIVLASEQVLASHTQIPMPNKQYFTLPFHKAIFRKALSMTALLVFIGFSICFYLYQAIFFSDVIGVLLTAPIFAYLTHLLYLIESKK